MNANPEAFTLNDVADAPEWLLERCAGASRDEAPPPAQDWREIFSADVPEGQRNATAASLAGHLLRKGAEPGVVEELLQGWNARRCKPPLASAEVAKVVESIAGKERQRREREGVAPDDFWPPRQPVPLESDPVPDLPPELLPPALGPWLVDAAERASQPVEFFAAAAVVVLASLVGRRIGIRPGAKNDWLVVPNLWGAIIAPSGMLKSNALSTALALLGPLKAAAKKEYAAKSLANEARKIALQAELRELQGVRNRGSHV